jgi:hypothetical protein
MVFLAFIGCHDKFVGKKKMDGNFVFKRDFYSNITGIIKIRLNSSF